MPKAHVTPTLTSLILKLTEANEMDGGLLEHCRGLLPSLIIIDKVKQLERTNLQMLLHKVGKG